VCFGSDHAQASGSRCAPFRGADRGFPGRPRPDAWIRLPGICRGR